MSMYFNIRRKLTTLEDLIDENEEIPEFSPAPQEKLDNMRGEISEYFANVFAEEMKELEKIKQKE